MNPSTNNSRKLIASYSRVSTSLQENEGTIETQLVTLREFASKRGYTIVKEYIDNGWSGDILARPDLDKLRQDAKEKVWDAILIYDPDRLARRYSYQELVMDELREAGIEVIFVTISAPKNSEDKILHGVRGLFAEYERAKITERFRLGKLRKVREGHLLVSEPLYGYTYVPKHEGVHGYYEVNHVEADVIRKIFTWVADEGLTMRKVIKRLQENGVKPRKSTRGVWSTSTLSTILRNKAYVGEARWGSSYAVVPENPINKEKYRKTKKSSRRAKPEDEWTIIPVPALISKDLFERTRTQLKVNFAQCARNKKNQYLLAGRIYCTCGKRRTGEGPQHGKHLYYRCSNRVACFPLPPTCHEHGINARIADKLIWSKISQLMSSPKLLAKQLQRWADSKLKHGATLGTDLGAIEKEMSKLKIQEERYNKAYGAELITIEQLREYTTPIRDRVRDLESLILKSKENITLASHKARPTKGDMTKFARAAKNHLKNLSFESKRAIVLNAVEKIVGTQQHIQVYGYIPISHVESFTSDRHRRAPQRREINTL